MKIIAFMGIAGSGKSTVAKILAERLGFLHISTGDLARRYIDGEWSSLGLPAPETQIRDLVTRHIFNARVNGYDGVIIDGMPRKSSQVSFLYGATKGDSLSFIHLIIDSTICKKRLLDRKRDDDTIISINSRFDTYHRTIDDITKVISKNKSKFDYLAVDATQSIDDILDEITREVM